MAKDVCCEVDSCAYNSSLKCEANEIKVCNCSNHEAKDVRETGCQTFKCK